MDLFLMPGTRIGGGLSTTVAMTPGRANKDTPSLVLLKSVCCAYMWSVVKVILSSFITKVRVRDLMRTAGSAINYRDL